MPLSIVQRIATSSSSASRIASARPYSAELSCGCECARASARLRVASTRLIGVSATLARFRTSRYRAMA